MSDRIVSVGSALQSAHSGWAAGFNWVSIRDLDGQWCMSKPDDTVPDRKPLGEAPGSATTPSGPSHAGWSVTSASPGYRSDPVPMDVLLRKVVQATPNVPNSLEPGVQYQATHAPAAPYAAAQPAGVFVANTEPNPVGQQARVGDDASSPRLEVATVATRPRTGPTWWPFALLGGLVVVATTAAIAHKWGRPEARPASLSSATPPAVLPGPAAGSGPSTVFDAASSVGSAAITVPSVGTASAASSATADRPAKLVAPSALVPTARPTSKPTATDPPPSPLIKQSPL
jgi:hypothetical protein